MALTQAPALARWIVGDLIVNAIRRLIGPPPIHERMIASPIDPPNFDQRHPLKKLRVGVYVIQRGRFRYADRPLAEILGCENPQALVGRPFWQWVHPEDRAQVCLVRGKTSFRCINENGEVRWVQMSGVNSLYNAKPANVGCLIDLGLWQASAEPLPNKKATKGKVFLSVGSEYSGLMAAGRDDFFGAALAIRDFSLSSNMERGFQKLHPFHIIIGQSDIMREVCRMVQNLADLEATVLVTGERGTGKELIAQSLHLCGRRAAKPFIRLNCSAFSEKLLERELFGCTRGAFTGAVQEYRGRVQAAEGGTIVLDEIGDISTAVQLKLLRIMQEKTFEMVGESTLRKADVRIVARTKKDLRRKVKSGEFSEELYHQLKLAEIALPPLRERLLDVPLLAEHFRQLFNSRFDRAIGSVSMEVLERLMAYHWPWNVRELENVIERAFWLCRGRDITIGHLPPEIKTLDRSTVRATIIPIHTSEGAQGLLESLSRTCWNRTKAANLLGVSRQTLYRKIRAYKIFEMM